ncbi:MAG: DUF4179 domain-containing protein [Sarcina sp.]
MINKNKFLKFSNENLSSSEIDTIKQNLKTTIQKNTKKNYKKTFIAASVAIFILGVAPVAAQTLPIIKEIYQDTRIVKGHKDYISYIGETANFKGGNITLDNIIVTENQIFTLSTITTDEKISDSNIGLFSLNYNVNQSANSDRFDSYGTTTFKERINDNSFIIASEFTIEGGKITKNDGINLNLGFNNKYNLTKLIIKEDFSKTLDDKLTLTLNKKISENLLLKSINSTVLKTSIIFSGTSSEAFFDSTFDLSNVVLMVDDKYHFLHRGGMMEKDYYSLSFDTLNNKDLKNAKSIKLLSLDKPSLPLNTNNKLSDNDINQIKASIINELIIK